MKCKLCNENNQVIFESKILNKYDIKYYHCNNCGFVQTEEPYWLEEAYQESINISDTGYMARNLLISQKLTVFLSIFFDNKSKYLDYAGGYGVLVRIMRDIGYDFYWDDKYTINIFAKGFEYENQEYQAITTFESFEHFVNPINEIREMLKISNNIIFSTEVLKENVPAPDEWWYYGLEHGQHISFYSEKSLAYIAEYFNLKYTNLGCFHLFSEKKVPFYLKILLKFSQFGLDSLLAKYLKSKTWEDHLKMKGL